MGSKLHTRSKKNPTSKLSSIMERAQEKWNIDVNWTKAYKARSITIDMVNGSFREQYTRIYDYYHELLRSNKGSTVKVNTQQFQGSEEDLENLEVVFCPHFKRLYICLNG